MSHAKFSRRAFLQATGMSGAMLPLLGARRAEAAAAYPKRIVFLTWPNGVRREAFWPTGEGADFQLPQILSGMEPFKKDMLVLGGLDCNWFMGFRRPDDGRTSEAGWGHDMYPALLTGRRFSTYTANPLFAKSGGQSLDQFLAAELQKKSASRFATLSLGARTSGGWQGSMSFRQTGEPVTLEGDPTRLFKTLFEGVALPKEQIDGARARRKSILDYLGRSLTSFGQRLATEDRQKVESHLQSIRELEQQVAGNGAVAAGCTVPMAPGAVDFKLNDNYPALMRAQMDLIVAAAKCNLTQVITLTCANTGGSGVVFSWLGAEYTGKGDEYPIREHHDIAHMQGRSPAHVQRYIGVNKWYYDQFAYLVKRFKETPEGTGSMLDNSVIAITNMTGDNHMAVGLPWVLVGSAGGYFKTGRIIKYGDWRGKTGEYWKNKGISYAPLLTSLARAMGVEVETFGDPQFGAGELPELRG